MSSWLRNFWHCATKTHATAWRIGRGRCTFSTTCSSPSSSSGPPSLWPHPLPPRDPRQLLSPVLVQETTSSAKVRATYSRVSIKRYALEPIQSTSIKRVTVLLGWNSSNKNAHHWLYSACARKWSVGCRRGRDLPNFGKEEKGEQGSNFILNGDREKDKSFFLALQMRIAIWGRLGMGENYWLIDHYPYL